MSDESNEDLRMTIRAFADIGWEIEVRYDEAGECARQEFTGAQDRLPTVALSTKREKNMTTWTAPDGGTLCVNRETGAIALTNAGKTLWRSDAPFSSHVRPVRIYEGIMSPKVTDFTDRSPFGPIGSLYETRMTRLRYPLPEKGPVLGLPGQTGEMNRRDYRFRLFNTDTFMHTPDRPPMYQSWPILFHRDEKNEGWMCIFHDNPSQTFVDIGDFDPTSITFESQTGNTRAYLIHDVTLQGASQKLTRLLGGCRMPPEWAFGYQQSRWSYMSTDEIRSVADRFRKENIPCDALHFDIDYMDGFRVFTADPKRFGDLRPCLDDLHEKGFKAVCIQDPGVKVDPAYDVYRRVMQSGKYLKTAAGEAFTGNVWPGASIYPDFGDSSLRDLWADIQTDWIRRYPFDGVWNDMNEPSNFDGQNKTTSTALTERGPLTNEWNAYGSLMAQASREGMDRASKEPTLVITRAGYPGVQRHAVIWHGDNQAWWEHLHLSLHTALAYSLCGAYHTGPDVPGFTGNPPDDLAVRFFQLGSWMPFFRGHSIYFAKDKEPYTFAPEARKHIEAAIKRRYALAEEWLEGFRRCTASNVSPMLPIFDAESKAVRGQFMLFEKFVVAPVMERDQTKKLIFLPEGSWHALDDLSGKPLKGNRWHAIDTDLSSVPVYVRSGETVVLHEPGRNIEETLASPRKITTAS